MLLTRPSLRSCVAASVCCAWLNIAGAQLARTFPQTAWRGTLVLGTMPDATLNGSPARLAPGARLHRQDNLLVQPATLYDQRLAVHYTTNNDGELAEIWVLRPEEAAVEPWPRNAADAQRLVFDALTQRWSRP